MKKTVDNRVSSWYNNQRRQGRHTSFGGLAQLGERLVSKHTPSQIVLRQSNSQQKTPSKRFASWILWGISSAGRALAWHARGQRFDPAILHHTVRTRTRFSMRKGSGTFFVYRKFCGRTPQSVKRAKAGYHYDGGILPFALWNQVRFVRTWASPYMARLGVVAAYVRTGSLYTSDKV